jgi:hypothetical protein
MATLGGGRSTCGLHRSDRKIICSSNANVLGFTLLTDTNRGFTISTLAILIGQHSLSYVYYDSTTIFNR